MKVFKLVLVSLFLMLIGTFALAMEIPKDFKDKSITVIVPYGAGGNTDITARRLAQKVSQQTGLNIVVVNKPGANGSIGAMFVATSKPDGLTLCQCDTGPVMVNNFAGIPNSPSKGDLVPVSASSVNALALIVSAAAPYSTLKEFMSYHKANSNTLSYASATTITKLLAEQLLSLENIKEVQSITYKSNAEVINSVLSGVTSFTITNTGDVHKLIETGKLKAIAIGSLDRLPILPDVPTMSSLYSKVYMSNYLGIFAPKGVPVETMQYLNHVWSNAVWSSDIISEFQSKGTVPVGGDLKKANDYFNRYYKTNETLFNSFGSLIKN